MKNTSVELHSLIDSMSKSEKRYFHVYAGRHFPKDNQYARLFSAIEKQKTYAEEPLKKHFSAGRSASHFAVIKKQLYSEVLNALHRYHEAQDMEMQLTRGAHQCQILLRKGLYLQCLHLLKKYRALAEENEQHTALLSLLDIEKKVHMRMQFTSIDEAGLHRLFEKQKKTCGDILLEASYQLDSGIVYALHYKKRITQGHSIPAFEKMIRGERYISMAQARTFSAKLDYLQLHALHAFIHGHAELAYQYNAEFLTLMDTHPGQLRKYSERYFSVLNNWLIDSLLLRKENALLQGIDRLRSLTEQPAFRNIQNLEAIVFRQSFILEMNYYTQTQAYDNITAKLGELNTGLKRYAREIALPHVVTMRFLLANAFFFSGKYSHCLDELQTLLRNKHAERISDLYRDARIMQLLAHFMSGDHQLCESLILSLQRNFHKQKVKYKTYPLLFTFLKKYMFEIRKPDVSGFRKKLEALSKKEETVFGNFDLLHWCRQLDRIKVIHAGKQG